MSHFRNRHPRTRAELREKSAGDNRPSRGYIPTERDYFWTRLQRSWKKFRRTRYRIKSSDAS